MFDTRDFTRRKTWQWDVVMGPPVTVSAYLEGVRAVMLMREAAIAYMRDRGDFSPTDVLLIQASLDESRREIAWLTGGGE